MLWKSAAVSFALAVPAAGGRALAAECGSPPGGGRRRPVIAARAALADPEVVRAVGAAWAATPPVPWPCGLDDREALLAKQGRLVFAACCPVERPGPEKPWISAEAWRALETLVESRKRLFAERRRGLREDLRGAFGAWRGLVLDGLGPFCKQRGRFACAAQPNARLRRPLRESAYICRQLTRQKSLQVL